MNFFGFDLASIFSLTVSPLELMLRGTLLYWFLFQPTGDSVTAFFQANPQWQEYSGFLHGEMISTLLDAAMTHCLFHHGIEAMTASLKVRFLEPVPCSANLEIKATLLERRRHVYLLNAGLASLGHCWARAEARFIKAVEYEKE